MTGGFEGAAGDGGQDARVRGCREAVSTCAIEGCPPCRGQPMIAVRPGSPASLSRSPYFVGRVPRVKRAYRSRRDGDGQPGLTGRRLGAHPGACIASLGAGSAPGPDFSVPPWDRLVAAQLRNPRSSGLSTSTECAIASAIHPPIHRTRSESPQWGARLTASGTALPVGSGRSSTAPRTAEELTSCSIPNPLSMFWPGAIAKSH
jgi:hypothetical protein